MTDQIGCKAGKSKTSYGYRRLETILKNNYKLTIKEISDLIKSNFQEWQGLNIRRDDLTLIIFKL